MKKFPLIAAAAGAIVAASAFGAQAMPAAPVAGASDAPIVDVAMGCGPGFFRGPYGRCRPMGWRRGPVVVVRPGWRRGWHRDRWHRW